MKRNHGSYFLQEVEATVLAIGEIGTFDSTEYLIVADRRKNCSHIGCSRSSAISSDWIAGPRKDLHLGLHTTGLAGTVPSVVWTEAIYQNRLCGGMRKPPCPRPNQSLYPCPEGMDAE